MRQQSAEQGEKRSGSAADVLHYRAVAKIETTHSAGGEPIRKEVAADAVYPGDELRYTIEYSNGGAERLGAGAVVVTTPVPGGTDYLPGTAGGNDTTVEYSVDGQYFSSAEPSGGVKALRWTYHRALAPGGSGSVFFHVLMRQR